MAHRIADIQYSRNRRGIVELTLSLWVETIAELDTVTPSGNNYYLGLREEDRRGSTWDSDTELAGYRLDITYRGISQSSNLPEEQRVSRRLEGEFSEEPIEKNPYLQRLKDEYGGYIEDGRLKFPEFLETGERFQLDGLNVDGRFVEDNPMFGWTTYPEFAAVFHETVAVTNLPSDLLDHIGEITTELPSPWATPPDKNWLNMSPLVEEFGDHFEIHYRKLLSPRGGWPDVPFGIVQV